MEGLKEYRTLEGIDNPYFLDIEYHVLYNNRPDCLLPVQIRNIDGHSLLLYEVTGMECMQTQMGRKSFSRDEMEEFLKDLKKMVAELERLMLDISQVRLFPEDIFRKKGGHYCWIYSPEKQDNPLKGIEKLFEWILASIDYNDFKLVQYTYYSYWCIRNHPFSEETLQKCLDYQPDKVGDYQPGNYETYFEDEKAVETVREYQENGGSPSPVETVRPEYHSYVRTPDYPDMAHNTGPMEETDEASATRFIPEIIFGLLSGIILIALAVFVVMGMQHNMLMDLKYIIGGLIIAFLLSADGLWYVHRRRKKKETEGKEETSSKRPYVYPSYDHSWDGDGATEVLSIRRDMLKPAFRSLETGKVYVIDDFPYYIGSEAGSNQMHINEPSVSRRHAAVIRGRQTGNYDLQDLKSTNGTWVDKTPVTYENPVRLEKGNVVRFAAKSFEFIILDQP